MGNYCSCIFDNGQDGRIQEIEDVKRERVKIQADPLDIEPMSVYIYSLNTQTIMPSDTSLKSSIRKLIATKYLKAVKIFQGFAVKHSILYGPPPTCEQVLEIERVLPQITLTALKNSENVMLMPTVKIRHGGYYEGQWNVYTEQPEGFGIMVYEDDTKYVGSFKNGIRDGYGRMIKADGVFYEGSFKNDIFTGKGILLKPYKEFPLNKIVGRDFFTTEWETTVLEKYAKAVKSGLFYGNCYSGRYGEDNQEAQKNTESTWQGYVLYSGNYFKGLKHGKGMMCFNDGSIYNGEFVENMMDGNGVFEWADGKKYIGNWKASRLHGEGIYTWPDGREYKGCYANGYRDGYGMFKWPDGKNYVGEWLNGNMHGVGTLTIIDKNGKKCFIKAIWEDGKKKKLIN
ncbi:hypothetical protein SteCoe_34442 [Stentor coeruleus]|uniref:MORN repeat protein n=1 Tax=Stentor coeruleus TaxID=5963 RepID=A0A1R2AUH4_9CILI|nr:hypothetical protein SteCoe_34442 [Stentor coeruleus]